MAAAFGMVFSELAKPEVFTSLLAKTAKRVSNFDLLHNERANFRLEVNTDHAPRISVRNPNANDGPVHAVSVSLALQDMRVLANPNQDSQELPYRLRFRYPRIKNLKTLGLTPQDWRMLRVISRLASHMPEPEAIWGPTLRVSLALPI